MRKLRQSNVRPTYLLVEPKCEGLSARKLVIEAILKRNVLLAGAADEAQTTLHVFPNVDAVVVHSEISDSTALVSWIRKQYPEKFIVFLAEPARQDCKGADAVISGQDPVELLAAIDVDFKSSNASNRRSALLDDLARTFRTARLELQRAIVKNNNGDGVDAVVRRAAEGTSMGRRQ